VSRRCQSEYRFAASWLAAFRKLHSLPSPFSLFGTRPGVVTILPIPLSDSFVVIPELCSFFTIPNTFLWWLHNHHIAIGNPSSQAAVTHQEISRLTPMQ
jgi:hypothetical protein